MLASCQAQAQDKLFRNVIDVNVPSISSDKSIRYDYDIVYVRARRAGDEIHKRFYTDFSTPVTMEPGADLMLLHPDGSEELLVEGGAGSITDPVVSFDAQWVYYTHIYNLQKYSQWNPPREGADGCGGTPAARSWCRSCRSRCAGRALAARRLPSQA